VQQPAFTEEAGPGSFFGNEGKSSFFSGMPVQAKLSISPPDDPQEREADVVADTAKGSFFQWKQQFCGIPILLNNM